MNEWVAVKAEALARMAEEFDKLRDDGLISVQRHSTFAKAVEALCITPIQSPDQITALVEAVELSIDCGEVLVEEMKKGTKIAPGAVMSVAAPLKQALASFQDAERKPCPKTVAEAKKITSENVCGPFKEAEHKPCPDCGGSKRKLIGTGCRGDVICGPCPTCKGEGTVKDGG